MAAYLTNDNIRGIYALYLTKILHINPKNYPHIVGSFLCEKILLSLLPTL